MTNGRDIVRRGYDALGPRYWEWSRDNDPKYREDYLALLEECLTPGSLVVELGSGTGIPTARMLCERHRVVCVDFSAAQLALVAQNVPGARLVRSDMSDVTFAPGSLDAVVAFYSIIHVPRDDHAALFASIARWLRPGGWFVASLGGPRDNPGATDTWIDGVEMWWSFYDSDTSLRLITEAGLTVDRSEVLKNFEDGREVQFLWVLARKPS